VLWYGAVAHLGADRAGLLTGVAPVAAAAAGVALGLPAPGPAVWVGIAAVVCGLVLGLRKPSVDGKIPTRHSLPTARQGRLRTAAGQLPRRLHPAED
jgi:drug/metabolite transporter (DMT)-like permease